jgi:hypothetical protein
MAPPLSINLHKQVAAVEGGMSCREAGGIERNPLRVVKVRATGEVTPKPQDGDRRSQAIKRKLNASSR